MAKRVAKRIQRNANKDLVYKEIVQKKTKKHTPEQLALMINPEDTADNPLTFHRLMEWLANTGWVYGYVRKRISPMDAHLYEDFAQSVWLEILNLNPDLMMEVWYHGKGKFINFIKKVIDLQLKCTGTRTYAVNKHFHHTHVSITNEQWHYLEEASPNIMYTDRYPVKYDCPSGNRKKMVMIEYEDLPISVKNVDDLIDNQIYLPDEIDDEEEH